MEPLGLGGNAVGDSGARTLASGTALDDDGGGGGQWAPGTGTQLHRVGIDGHRYVTLRLGGTGLWAGAGSEVRTGSGIRRVGDIQQLPLRGHRCATPERMHRVLRRGPRRRQDISGFGELQVSHVGDLHVVKGKGAWGMACVAG